MTETIGSTYTVMADCGVGEFLWRKDGHDPAQLVGGNVYSLMDSGCEHEEMSPELFADFLAWADRYMRAQPLNHAHPVDIDWDSFNAEGVRLTRRLNDEMTGLGHIVRYARAWDDPKREQEPHIDIRVPLGDRKNRKPDTGRSSSR